MISEGTAFLRIKKNPHANDLNWIDKLKQHSFLRFFPNQQEAFLQSGQIMKFPPGYKISLVDNKLSSLLIPLNQSVNLRLASGRFGEENVFSIVPPFEAIGSREVLTGGKFPFFIETDSEETFFFAVPSEKYKTAFDAKDLKLVDKVCNSQALFHLCSWFQSFHISNDKILAIIESLETGVHFPKMKEINIKSPSLILIENGLIQASNHIGDAVIRSLLSQRDWFGGSQLTMSSAQRIDFTVLEDTDVSLISFKVLENYLPADVLSRIRLEPCVQKEALTISSGTEGSQLKINADHYATFEDIDNLKIRSKSQKVKLEADISLWSFVTLWNFLIFLEVELNEKQVQALSTGKSSIGLGSFAQILEDMGFISAIRIIRIGFNYDLDHPMLTVIAGRPSLYLGVYNKKSYFLTPDLGVVFFENQNLQGHWNGVCLVVTESYINQALKSRADALALKPEVAGKALMSYFVNLSKNEIFNLSIFRFFQSLAVLFIPSYLLGLINQVVTYKRFDHLSIYYTGLGLFIAFQMIALYYSSILANDILVQFKVRVQPYFYKLFLNQPNSFVTNIKAGLIQSRMSLLDFALIGLKSYRIEMRQYITSFVLFLLLIGIYSWQASLVIILFSAMGIGLVLYLRAKGGLDMISTAQQRQQVIDMNLDFLNGFASIKSTRSEYLCRKRIEKVAAELVEGTKQYSKTIVGFTQYATLVYQMGSVLALYVVINELMYTQSPPQNALALSLYLGYCATPFSGIVGLLTNYNIAGVMGIPGQMIRNEASKDLSSLKLVTLQGGVRLEKVAFRYSDRLPMAISDISFVVQPGEVIAIVGRSGSGKTTLGRILSRQSEPTAGRILFDEVDSRVIDPACLQTQIGFVSQTPSLFSGTIAQNIALSDDILDENSILEAAKASNAHAFIEKLPGAYNYILKEEGKGLSVGQRQLLAMARILYAKPHILVLDEATAHLDPKSERIISDQLLGFHRRQTIFVIVQRISTARKADRIIVMKNGRVVEMGDHNKLLSQNGEYSELFRYQVGADG